MNQRHLDQQELKRWVTSVGGPAKAALIVQRLFECSISKAEKIVAGRYTSLIPAAEQIVLATEMKRPRDVAFPLVSARGKRRAS